MKFLVNILEGHDPVEGTRLVKVYWKEVKTGRRISSGGPTLSAALVSMTLRQQRYDGDGILTAEACTAAVLSAVRREGYRDGREA